MRRGICAFLFLAAFSPLALAQTLDRAKLRQTIEMPAVSASLGVQFRAHERVKANVGARFTIDN